jgi:TRAP-type C4-dicarboxylate transport system substrate-binding protein
MTKKSLIIALIAVMAMTATLFAGCGGSDSASEGGEAASGEQITLRWAGIGATDAIDTWAAEEVSARVAERTDGAINIEVYPASQLGDLTQAYDEIKKGAIDMGLFTVYGTYDPAAEVTFLPYLTTTHEQFEKVFARDGDMFKELERINAEQGISLLGFWNSGHLGLVFTKLDTPVEDLFDPTVKKPELVRVPGMESMQKGCEALGFNTTVIPYADVYTAMQTGTVDGSWNGGVYVNYMSFRDVTKYYVDYRCTDDVYSCIMNTEKLESLTEEQQNIIRDTVEEVMAEANQKTAEQEEQSFKDMEEYGITVIRPTDEQLQAMRDYFIKEVWPDLAKPFNQDLIEEYSNME